MTLAADLAHEVCPTGGGGGDVDPLAPFILGDQSAQNYSVQTFDLAVHQWKLEIVYQVPGGVLKHSVLSYDADGVLLLDGNPLIEAIPEIADAVAAAAASAVQASTSATEASDASENASTFADRAAASAASSDDSAVLASNAAALAQQAVVDAQAQAQGTRLLPLSGPVSASETYSAAFLNTRRRATPAGAMVVTIPPNIYINAEQKEALGLYRLEGAGSVQFVPQTGGSILTPARRLMFQRNVLRTSDSVPPTGPVTFTYPITLPAVVSGRLVVVVHSAQSTLTGHTVAVSSTGGLTWTAKRAFPATALIARNHQFGIYEAPLVGIAAGTVINISVVAGTATAILDNDSCGTHVFDDVAGAMLLPPSFAEQVATGTLSSTLPALSNRALVVADSCCRGSPSAAPPNSHVSFSANMPRLETGNSIGVPDTTVSTSHTFKNSVFASGAIEATAAGDFTVSSTFQITTFAPDLALFAYPAQITTPPAMTLRLRGTTDTLAQRNGEAQLWFAPSGTEVFLSIDT